MIDDMHRRHLAEANRHLNRSLEIIAKQRDLIDRLEKHGQDAWEARRLLRLVEETRELMQAHRELILSSLRQIQGWLR